MVALFLLVHLLLLELIGFGKCMGSREAFNGITSNTKSHYPLLITFQGLVWFGFFLSISRIQTIAMAVTLGFAS